MYGGPPCETWSSISLAFLRYRGRAGSALRSGEDVYEEIWGWKTLRLRDIQQILCSNALLLFMLTIFVTQLISGGGALMEHPARPGHRQGRQPPSVWLLPIVQFLLKCQRVRMIHISQGYWQAHCHRSLQRSWLRHQERMDDQFLEWLNKHRDDGCATKANRDGTLQRYLSYGETEALPGTSMCWSCGNLHPSCISDLFHSLSLLSKSSSGLGGSRSDNCP